MKVKPGSTNRKEAIKRTRALLEKKNSSLLYYKDKHHQILVRWSCGHTAWIRPRSLKKKKGSKCWGCFQKNLSEYVKKEWEKSRIERKAKVEELLREHDHELLYFNSHSEKVIYRCFCGNISEAYIGTLKNKKNKCCLSGKPRKEEEIRDLFNKHNCELLYFKTVEEKVIYRCFCGKRSSINVYTFKNKKNKCCSSKSGITKMARELGLSLYETNKLLREVENGNIMLSKKEVQNVTVN